MFINNLVMNRSSAVLRSTMAIKKPQVHRQLCTTQSARHDFRPSDELAKERYDSRVDEDIEKKRSRLMYQSKKRGMLENGVLLSSFAEKFLNKLNPTELDQYDRLINLPTNDWDIYYWATKTKPTPVEYETEVMRKLREHINSKVSSYGGNDCDKKEPENGNETTNGSEGHELDDKRLRGRAGRKPLLERLMNKATPDDIAMPIIKEKYELEMDFSAVDTVNYRSQLFDDRVKNLGKKESIVMMTDWRRRHFERRIRRTISAPISLRHMSNDKKVEVFTQRLPGRRRDFAIRSMEPRNLIDSEYDKNLKQHNFLQYLLSSNFTDDPLDYDDEASAWAEMIWHRNYGCHDAEIAPSSIKCSSCNSKLQCIDYGLDGYVPKERFAKIIQDHDKEHLNRDEEIIRRGQPVCQRCMFEKAYGTKLSTDVDNSTFVEVLKQFKTLPPSILCILVDLTEFPCGLWEDFVDQVGLQHKIIIVGNKLDLLPVDGHHMINRVKYSLNQNLNRLRSKSKNVNVQDVVVLSAKTGFGIASLVSRLLKNHYEKSMNIYLCGTSNSGKSTLFNALLQSDLSEIREGDLLTRLSTYEMPSGSGEPINLLRFPIYRAEEWEVANMIRKSKIVERNMWKLEHNLTETTKCRQKTMPHMSMLINRLEYPKMKKLPERTVVDNSALEQVTKPIQMPNFARDHPLVVNSPKREILSVSEKEYSHNAFVYMTPSTQQEDQLHDLLTLEEKMLVFPNKTIVPRKYTLRPMESLFLAGLARIDLLTSTSVVVFTIYASSYLPVHVMRTRKADQFYKTFLGTPYLGVPFAMNNFGTRDGLGLIEKSKSLESIQTVHWEAKSEQERRKDENKAEEARARRLEGWPELINSKPDFHIRSSEWARGVCDIVLSSCGWALVSLGPDQECIVRAFTPQGRGIFKREPALLPFGRQSSRAGGRKLRDSPLFKNEHFSNERFQVS